MTPMFAWVDAFGDQAAIFCMQLASAHEKNIPDGAYADPPFLAGDRVTAGPRLGGRVADFEVEPLPVVVSACLERPGLAGACLLDLSPPVGN